MKTLVRADLSEIVAFFKTLQDEICDGLEKLDGKATFREDLWDRPEGGGGRSRVIENGNIFEKGGVNFSHVHGPMPAVITNKLGFEEGVHFDATGVSIVIHPESPKQPIIHMNVRYFQLANGIHWFGGGIDLTPIYVVQEDRDFFHDQLKETCNRHNPQFYPKYKEICDRYFYIKHRHETRGVGGIFFDHLKAETEAEKAANFAFVQDVGKTFLPAYVEIIKRHIGESHTDREKQFQMLRRSRYVEFNLVYDKGTKFGLDTSGRIESILMSMPPQANWVYDFQPEPGSLEEATLAYLRGDMLAFHENTSAAKCPVNHEPSDGECPV